MKANLRKSVLFERFCTKENLKYELDTLKDSFVSYHLLYTQILRKNGAPLG